MKERVFVLDTSAIIAGFTPNLEEQKQYTVPKVLEEARSLSSRLKLETAIRSGQVKIKEPSRKMLKEVRKKVEKTRDRVSKTDIQILGLAYELKESEKNPEIMTDDYAIQNLAELLNIEYSKVAKPGISEVYEWEKICPACGRVYNEDISKCKACGSRLRRKPKD